VNPVRPDFVASVEQRLPDLAGRRLQEMDEADIDMEVLSLTVPGLRQDLKAGEGVEAARAAHAYLAAAVAKHASRFAGSGTGRVSDLLWQWELHGADSAGRSGRWGDHRDVPGRLPRRQGRAWHCRELHRHRHAAPRWLPDRRVLGQLRHAPARLAELGVV